MNIRNLDLNLLLVFDAIMQDRQVSKAAIRIGRTQSAVSHSLKKLRAIFNDDLFVRTAGGMGPTPLAIELSEPISSALADIQSVLDSHLDFNPKISKRHFNIGIYDFTSFQFLPTIIEKLRSLAPNATLQGHHVSEDNVFNLLRTGQIDCAILGNVTNVPEGIISEDILTEKFMCAVDKNNPILGKPITLEAYLSFPHLHIARDKMSVGQADIELEKIGLKRTIMSIIPHYLVVPQIISGTDLIVTIGEGALIDFAESNGLKLFTPPISMSDMAFTLLTDQRAKLDPGNIWLCDIIRQRAEELRKKNQGLG